MPLTCLRCGSDKVIPELALFDAYGQPTFAKKPIGVLVEGRPDAWFFRGQEEGLLVARVCGGCGFTELHTRNFRALYEKYQQARQG
jgi:hypothetical protein